jgi:glycosyltransferase involved in cell wall biosynthesis
VHDPRHIVWLVRLIRQQGIDLVHTHLAYGNVVGQLAAAASRRPALATIHSTRDRHRNLPALKRSLQGVALRRAAVVVACSPDVAISVTERFRIRASKLVVLPNGIDCAAYAVVDRNAAQARRVQLLDGHAGPLVVAVGTLSSVKGHEHLVEATARLVGRFPEIRVVIVGRDGDNAVRVRQLIAARGLRAHILLAGESKAVATTLAAADLFVQPSRREGLPLAVLEAMAAGVPVVASAVGGIASSVEEGSTLRQVPPSDPIALAEAMADVLGDPDASRTLAARGHAYVTAGHNAGAWARALEATYAELTACRANRA